MELFDKKFVHFMWDDTLAGKECFIADNIYDLMLNVQENAPNYKGTVLQNQDTNYPFVVAGSFYRFAYYDPNYDVKRAYHALGKQIQYLSYSRGTWCDCTAEPEWADDYEYRIKPEICERMTRRQLAEWLAKGNGELTWGSSVTVCSALEYYSDRTNGAVPDEYKIRRWGSDEWVEPTVDIYKEDCNV